MGEDCTSSLGSRGGPGQAGVPSLPLRGEQPPFPKTARPPAGRRRSWPCAGFRGLSIEHGLWPAAHPPLHPLPALSPCQLLPPGDRRQSPGLSRSDLVLSLRGGRACLTPRTAGLLSSAFPAGPLLTAHGQRPPPGGPRSGGGGCFPRRRSTRGAPSQGGRRESQWDLWARWGGQVGPQPGERPCGLADCLEDSESEAIKCQPPGPGAGHPWERPLAVVSPG